MSQSVFIIAEAGVNHNGSLDLAHELIDAAASAGADAVKFQSFKAENLVSQTAPKAEYQKKTSGAHESQFAMLKKLELDETAHRTLLHYCEQKGIEFLSTPFDLESLQLLNSVFRLRVLKIPSGELTNAPFLMQIGKTGKPAILSTGMSTIEEIEMALGVLAFAYLGETSQPSLGNFQKAYASKAGKKVLQEKLTLLHCTSEYPAPVAEVNLRAMDTLAQHFALPVGYSDHTAGIHISLAAVARGAKVIEKHFTLDRNLPGPDHQASLEPSELHALVQQVREIELALGDGVKMATAAELKNRALVRKSLVAAKPIHAGEVFTEENLSCKRPGSGKSPFFYWQMLGQVAKRAYIIDEAIDD